MVHILIAGCTVLPIAPEVQITLIAPTTEMQTPTVASDAQLPLFKITTDNEGNELAMSSADEVAIFDVRSQSGIGSATVELISGSPRSIVLRVHLQGLEEFRLMYDEIIVKASVSSRAVDDVAESVVLSDGAEQSIALDDPSWLDIQIISDQNAPNIPLDQGYFEITLPDNFLNDARRTFSIRWIDFYR